MIGPLRSIAAMLLRVSSIAAAVCMGARIAAASIVLSGDVVPSPPAGDPWNVGGTLSVGELSNGTLTIDAGSDVTNTDGYVANLAGSTGTATISGIGSTWNSSGELRMGNLGSGTLDVLSGGSVSAGGNARIGNSLGGVGVATVDGAGSLLTATNFLLVGREGSGTLRIQNQAVVNDLTGGIATVEGSNGAVTIEGMGSAWNNTGELQVAVDGTATLSITGGGLATSVQGYIAAEPEGNGTATISGAGSAWNVGSQLQVGYGGNGTLNVDSGGSVTSASAFVGVLADGFGTVNVNDVGTTWNNSGELHIGYDGNGDLEVQNGGVLQSGSAFIGTNESGDGTGTVDGAGSSWSNSGTLTVGSAGIGTLTVNNGGTVSTGALKGTGGVRLDGGVLRLTAADSSSNIIMLGEGGGTVDVATDVTATIAGEIRGSGGLRKTGDGTFAATGLNTYSGDTRVDAGGFNLGQAFLNDAADVYLKTSAAVGLNYSGTDDIHALIIDGLARPIGTYGAIGSGADHPLSVFFGSGLLRVSQVGLLGDYNRNGVVDAADYTVWRNQFGSSTYLPNDDTPGVGFDDYVRWKSRYGQTAGGGAAVPEPDVVILSFLALVLANAVGRRRS